MENLAYAYINMGHGNTSYDTGISLMRKVVEFKKNHFGAASREYYMTQKELGNVYENSGKLIDAEKTFLLVWLYVVKLKWTYC
jgi:hypothetical protein